MPKAALFDNPRPQFLTNTGAVASGYQLFFYEPSTSTKKDTYTDSGKGTSNPNPIVLDSAGRPDNSGSPIDIWLDGSYKVVLATDTDTDPPASPVWSVDNVSSLWTSFTYSAKTANYPVVESDRDSYITMDASGGNRTVTLLAAATAGSGFVLTVKKIDSSSNTVTIDGNASETIDGATTFVLTKQYDSIGLICDGSNWFLFNESTETIYDGNGNELVEFTTTASAVNHLKVTNAATTNPPKLGVESEANIGLLIEDSNDNELLEFISTASAVNHPKITNAATGNKPAIGVESEANIGLTINDSNDNEMLDFTPVATAVNYVDIANSTTGNSPIITFTGDDTDVSGNITMKGDGQLLISKEDARTNENDFPLRLQATTSGTPAAGLGVGMEFTCDTADESASIIGALAFNYSNINTGTEDSNLQIYMRDDGGASNGSYILSLASGATSYVQFRHAATSPRIFTLPDMAVDDIVVQRVSSTSTTAGSTTSTFPDDDTIPQNTEGAEYTTLSITPKSTTSILHIRFVAWISATGANACTVGLFQDSTANALQVTRGTPGASGHAIPIVLEHIMTSGTTSSTTFKIRYGANTGTMYMIRNANEKYSTADSTVFSIVEYSS